MTDNQKTKQFLREQEFMVLAVTLPGGTPWVVPVKIQLWWGNAFEWDSKLDTEHSKAIKKQPEVAITIFQKQSDAQIGFYATGKAELVEEKTPGIGRYRFIAERCWLNDETFIKREVSLD